MADKALEGRTVLVTGSSKGIGAATAKALAAQGAHVILTGRDVRTLEAVEDAIHAVGGASTRIEPSIKTSECSLSDGQKAFPVPRNEISTIGAPALPSRSSEVNFMSFVGSVEIILPLR